MERHALNLQLATSRVLLTGQLLAIRLGWARGIAILLLIIAAAMHWLALPQLNRQRETSTLEIARLRSGAGQPPATQSVGARYAAFRAILTKSEERDDVLKTVFSEAAQVGLQLSQGDYELVLENDGGYRKLLLNLPVKGSYPQIRGFVDTILTSVPSASLDEINLQRDNVKNTMIDARLKLAFYMENTD